MSSRNRNNSVELKSPPLDEGTALSAAIKCLPEPSREFPDRPCVAVGGIVVHNGKTVLVRRGSEPLRGEWSIPGGLVQVGERLQHALKRELREETGLRIEPVEVVGIFERIERGVAAAERRDNRGVRYHYVIVDYVCRLGRSRGRHAKPPRLAPATDVIEAEWVPAEELGLYDLSDEAEKVILKAMQFVGPDC